MNVFVHELASDEVNPAPEKTNTKLVIDDNIGEAIHVHLRNFRLELSVEDFGAFAENVRNAREELANGDR